MTRTSLATFASILDLDHRAALETADSRGFSIEKDADPIAPARSGLTVDEAVDVAHGDVGLIWILVD